ncbi:hypothetical protein [Bacillus sp. X1(2014)]|uniref:hypothetical protein n=1 Tax=Bacillus sp. X1(2014) TaxID=1565991 RepID=UPI0011A41EBF|nr:hypothetical protein [Bacillus sp. X1(2014)]
MEKIWHTEQNERVAKIHKKTNNWHSQHNKRVSEFHKNHASKIEAGDNGNGLFARWERFVYNQGKALFKAAK